MVDTIWDCWYRLDNADVARGHSLYALAGKE